MKTNNINNTHHRKPPVKTSKNSGKAPLGVWGNWPDFTAPVPNTNRQMKGYAAALFILTAAAAHAQDDSTACVETKPSLTVSAFAEVYYGYDMNRPTNNRRPPFVYSHNRHNEVNVNLAFVKMKYDAERIRANLALATGTYMQANYAPEPDVIKNIYEANIGVRLLKDHSFWLDAGVMQSHIGFESAHTPSCRTLTRSIIADNSPYYESGVKLSYSPHAYNWYLALMALNGWQRIYRPDGSTTLSGGSQVTYTPSARVSVNYSTFIGNSSPDSTGHLRFFHDVYAVVLVRRKFEFIAGIDYGTQQRYKDSETWDKWWGGAAIVTYKTGKKTSITGRAEYYRDKHGIIIIPVTAAPFKTAGYSINFDYHIVSNALWRTEAKLMNSENVVYLRDGKPVTSDLVFTTSLSVSFGK